MEPEAPRIVAFELMLSTPYVIALAYGLISARRLHAAYPNASRLASMGFSSLLAMVVTGKAVHFLNSRRS